LNILWIYQRLLTAFGPQGWWPVTPAGGLRPIYSPAFSRAALSPAQQFEVAVGALLTQNTAWKNVEKALEPLIQKNLLSPRALVEIRLSRLQRYIRSSGYFRQKSKRLRAFSRYLISRWQGRLERLLAQPTRQARESLLSQNGIGPETADSILLYAGRHPVFVVDAYARRIGQRFGLFRTSDYESVQKIWMSSLPSSIYVFREAHALLVELGKRFCRPRPRCSPCPLRARCVGASL
jgi:endonuclease-3 related protein